MPADAVDGRVPARDSTKRGAVTAADKDRGKGVLIQTAVGNKALERKAS